MDIHLPEGLLAGRATTKTPRKKRMFVVADGIKVAVLDRWRGGFSTPKMGRPLTRGIVDLFDGPAHVSHGLAYLSAVKDDRRVYAFKTTTDPAGSQPLDHERLTPAPKALLPRS